MSEMASQSFVITSGTAAEAVVPATKELSTEKASKKKSSMKKKTSGCC